MMLLRLISGIVMLFLVAGDVEFNNVDGLEEICDNGVDDDGDGLIDLNDSDCNCVPPIYPSLVPNHSFEDTLCCPEEISQLECAVAWQQASYSTTDYYHTCSPFYEESEFSPPLPLPDGDGFSGFVNSVSKNEDGSLREYKEYAGACLNGPMKEGAVYRLEFMIGFSSREFSPSIRLGLYGTSSCENLPFGVGDNREECPGKHAEWIELGQVRCVYKRPEWRNFYIDFIPDRDIDAIAIGPNCDVVNADFYAYYYLDDLQLSKPESIEVEFKDYVEQCNQDTLFSVEQKELHTFQWYKEGVALVGESQYWIGRDYGEGLYQVKVSYGGLCEVFEKPFQRKVSISDHADMLCYSSDYLYYNNRFDSPGVYEVLLKDRYNCDSIVNLTLEPEEINPDTTVVLLGPNGKVNYKSKKYTKEGVYEHFSELPEVGCPELEIVLVETLDIVFPNVFSPNDDGINDEFVGKGLHFDLIERVFIYDRWGNLISDDKIWFGKNQGRPSPSGVYVYMAEVSIGEIKYVLTGNVTLVR